MIEIFVYKCQVRAYCHVVIKLSDTLQTFAPEKERTSNVHGVRWEFIQEGIRRSKECDAHKSLHSSGSREAQHGRHHHNTTVYFIGKILWTKGFDKMLEMENYYKQCTGHYFAMDIYGNGPEEKEIQIVYRYQQHFLIMLY
jgi:digalactosyldiacylglycerol synthase